MRIKLTLITITGLLFLNLTAVRAQIDTTGFTTSRLSAARELVATTGMTDLRFTLMRNNSIKSLSASIPEKNRDKFITDLNTFFDKYLPSGMFKDETVKIYAAAFTEDELKQLVVFYSSVLGKKIINKMPDLMQKCMLMDQQVLAQHSTELQSIIEASVKQ